MDFTPKMLFVIITHFTYCLRKLLNTYKTVYTEMTTIRTTTINTSTNPIYQKIDFTPKRLFVIITHFIHCLRKLLNTYKTVYTEMKTIRTTTITTSNNPIYQKIEFYT